MNAQLRKAGPFILVVILGVFLFLIRQCRHSSADTSVNKNNVKRPDPNAVNRDRGFDRRVSYLEYSNHANCRMKCRTISAGEVEEIMQEGNINYNKSDLQNARCPRYALEGITGDNQKVRIIFAQCNDKTVVVTVIDLDKEWTCACPGDDKKFVRKDSFGENKN
jgi:hypothetical protein